MLSDCRALTEESSCNLGLYIAEKYTSGLQFCRWQYGSIFIRLVVVVSRICEITRNSEKIRTYSRSSLSKVIAVVANRTRMYNFLLVINSYYGRGLSVTFSRYWRLKLENSPFPHSTLGCRRRHTEREPVRIFRWNLIRKNQMDGATAWLWRKLHTSIVLTAPPVLQTDGQTDERTGDSIIAR